MSLRHVPTDLDIDEARDTAAHLNAGNDDDWSYEVRRTRAGRAIIVAIDDDGIEVGPL